MNYINHGFFRFSPDHTNLVLREFEKCGVIVKHVPGPSDANWIHILYQVTNFCLFFIFQLVKVRILFDSNFPLRTIEYLKLFSLQTAP